MRTRIRINRAAAADLAALPEPDRQDFNRRLDEVVEAPITNSVPHREVDLTTYALRRFVFGRGVARIAIFTYDVVRRTVVVLRCRVQQPREIRD